MDKVREAVKRHRTRKRDERLKLDFDDTIEDNILLQKRSKKLEKESEVNKRELKGLKK